MACGPSVHVARVTNVSLWARLRAGGALLQGSSETDGQRHPCILVIDPTLGFSLATWVRGPVSPGPLHSRGHCALALSSSLCTVLYSTWKCCEDTNRQGWGRQSHPAPRLPAQPLTWTAVYAMPR